MFVAFFPLRAGVCWGGPSHRLHLAAGVCVIGLLLFLASFFCFVSLCFFVLAGFIWSGRCGAGEVSGEVICFCFEASMQDDGVHVHEFAWV